MLTLLHKQPVWIVAGGGAATALLLTVLTWGWVVRPAQAQDAAARVAADAHAAQQAEVRQLDSRLAELEQGLTSRRQLLQDQPQHLGQRRQLNRQIARLIELARGHGLEVVQLQPAPLLPGEYFNRVPMTLEAAAGFAEHLAFLEDLHGSVPSVAVVGLQLDTQLRDPRARPTGRYELHWFTELPQAVPPGATASSAPGSGAAGAAAPGAGAGAGAGADR